MIDTYDLSKHADGSATHVETFNQPFDFRESQRIQHGSTVRELDLHAHVSFRQHTDYFYQHSNLLTREATRPRDVQSRPTKKLPNKVLMAQAVKVQLMVL